MPNWLELPNDITANILKRLPTVEIVTSACLVCSLWWNICKDPFMWSTIHLYDFYYYSYHNRISLMEICRYAIKRSCGHLEKNCIDVFCNDDLLQFLAEDDNNLRCMQLLQCEEFSDKGFSEAVMKFPLLEEVHISMLNLSKDSLEALGQSCPLLKSLTLSRMNNLHSDDKEALIISETMPRLCHLVIEGNGLTNVGLIAILDGCPLLESLNIQYCENVILTDSLKKRLLEQIKDLQVPILNEYTSDEEYSDE